MNHRMSDSTATDLATSAEQRALRNASDAELRDELRARSAPSGQVALTVSEQHFSGPLPPPDSLAKYKEIDARLPDRIVTMAEVQQTENNAAQQSDRRAKSVACRADKA